MPFFGASYLPALKPRFQIANRVENDGTLISANLR
jgi:hypothetical protein